MHQAHLHRRFRCGALLALALLLAGACRSAEGTVAARGDISVAEQSLAFGDVPVLNTRALTVEVSNFGRAPIRLLAVGVVEEGTPFGVGTVPATVDSGDAQKIEVTFQPGSLDGFAATLRIDSDDEDTPRIELPLTGRGFTVAAMELPGTLAFGKLCEGGESVQKLVIHSSGTADLILESIRFGDGTAAEFGFISSTRTPVTVPTGTDLTLDVRFAPKAGATAAPAGTIEIVSTDPLKRQVSVALSASVDRAPVAVIREVLGSAPGATVTLDGTDSNDPDGELPLSWTWSLRSSPIGSHAVPSPADASTASMLLDLPGQYTVQLKVRDANGCQSAPVTRDVLAKPAQQMMVELVWDNIDADLDLHMVPDGQPFFGSSDCYFADGHMRPDWGVQGDPADDPSLDRDALTGYGPEIVGYAAPATGRYTVMVHYYSAHRSKTPATTATLRLYLFGVVRAEMRRTLQSENQRWTALSVDWPAATSTSIDTLE